MAASNITEACQPEIIRSKQKDQFFLTLLRNNSAKLVISCLGPSIWIKYQKEITTFIDLCYFLITTGSGFQTLGEEYCNLIQVESSKLKLPSPSKIYLMILLHCLGPYIADKIVSKLQALANNSGITKEVESYTNNGMLAEFTAQHLHKALPMIRRVHLVLFYMQGSFYDISKRVTGVRYALIRDFLKDKSAAASYQFLGFLLCLQLGVLFPLQMHGIFCRLLRRREMTTPKDLSGTTLARNLSTEKKQSCKVKCSLCLSGVTDCTATTCGHLFCWSCIVDWISAKLECPVCREEVLPSRLIYLRNFEMS